MAWNEPNDNNSKDPWGRPKKPQGPPELDKVLKSLQQKLESILGKKTTTPPGEPGAPASPTSSSFAGITVAAIVLLVWFLSGIYIVKPAEQAVVLRLGKYSDTVNEGPHWAPRFIDSVSKVDVQKIYPYTYTSDMLTKDENIVTVTVSVQYRVINARNYLFDVVDPVVTLQEATASALRQVIGNTTLDDVLTSGRELVRQQVQVQLEEILRQYKIGITVSDVALQPAKAPEQVKEAFDDAIKAEQDRERYINQAQAYLEQKVALATGTQKRILAGAGAYQQQVVLNSQGETARYLAMLPQYQQAPEVTRERLYIGALEDVLSNSSKIFVDAQKGNNLLLGVPLQQLIAQTVNATSATTVIPPLTSSSNEATTTNKDDVASNFSSGQGEDTPSNSSRYSERTGRGG